MGKRLVNPDSLCMGCMTELHLHCVGFLPGEACMCQGVFSEGDRRSKCLRAHVFGAAFGFSFMQYGDVHAALGQDPVCLYERTGGLYQRGRKSVALLSDAGYCFGPRFLLWKFDGIYCYGVHRRH